jgi:hypothetical protein
MEEETEEFVTRVTLDDPTTEDAPGVHAHPPTPNRANMRGGSSVIRSHVTTLEHEELTERVLAEAPARVSGFDPGAKPEPGSTPWRSVLYVNERHSADGHGYAIGDTVSEAEARRQGLLEQRALPPISGGAGRRLCQRCQGRGTYSKSKPRGHKADCACYFCGACPACNGSRYEKEVVDAGL